RRNTDVADMLGVTEGTIRYHQRLRTEGAVDGRSKQRQLAADYAEPIRFYREQHQEAGISVTRSTTGWLRTTSIQGRSAQCIATGHVVVDSDELGQRFRSKVDGDSDARWYSKGVSALEGLLINSCVHFGSS